MENYKEPLPIMCVKKLCKKINWDSVYEYFEKYVENLNFPSGMYFRVSTKKHLKDRFQTQSTMKQAI